MSSSKSVEYLLSTLASTTRSENHISFRDNSEEESSSSDSNNPPGNLLPQVTSIQSVRSIVADLDDHISNQLKSLTSDSLKSVSSYSVSFKSVNKQATSHKTEGILEATPFFYGRKDGLEDPVEHLEATSLLITLGKLLPDAELAGQKQGDSNYVIKEEPLKETEISLPCMIDESKEKRKRLANNQTNIIGLEEENTLSARKSCYQKYW